MGGPGSIIFVSLTILFLGYFMYIPLPAGVAQPWKLRFSTLLVDISISISHLREKITGTPFADTFHALSVSNPKLVHPDHPELEVKDLTLDGIPARVYKPEGLKEPAPCVVYYHGGGWVQLSIDKHDHIFVALAIETNMIVVAVRYRYAHHHPYPVPFDDSVKAMAYVLRNGDVLGIDTNRVAISGDSAGGNLAAAVSIRLSQEDPSAMPPIKLQVLICPALQALTFNTTSMRQNGNWYLKRSMMAFFWAAYLGLPLNSDTYNILLKDAHVSSSIQRSIYGSYIKKIRSVGSRINENYNKEMASKLDHLVTDPFVAPLMADDLSKMPPAYVIVAEFDILKDEGVLYAERLKQAGVPTDVWLTKGLPHITNFLTGFSWLVDNSDTDGLYSNVADYIKKHL